MTDEEAGAMLTVTLGSVAEMCRAYPMEKRQDVARMLRARAAACDGSPAAQAYRSAADTVMREDQDGGASR